MGYMDNLQTEEALNDLRERNAALRAQNADLKDFIKHLSIEVSSFLNYNSITKEL
jgi:cell division protein FtsB